MNRTAQQPPYPQGCGRILWILKWWGVGPCDVVRQGVRASATLSAPYPERLRSLCYVTLSPNKYTSWGKVCGLRREIRADLGISCGRHVVVPSRKLPSAGIYAGAGEKVLHLGLRIRPLSPPSTQPMTTNLYMFVTQHRQAIGTGALGDNPAPASRVIVPARLRREPCRNARPSRWFEGDRFEQMVTGGGCTRPDLLCACTGITGPRQLAAPPTKQTMSPSRLSRSCPARSRRMPRQAGGSKRAGHTDCGKSTSHSGRAWSASDTGLQPRQRPADPGLVRLLAPSRPGPHRGIGGGGCRTSAVGKTGAGDEVGLVSE